MYYVSNEGNDNNSGTSSNQAWQSLNKVNSLQPKPGDSILFRRGDSWSGSIIVKTSGEQDNPILYGAYGVGERPLIQGGRDLVDWTLHSGNIYKASIQNPLNQLFVNNNKVSLSRFPNKGYLTIESLFSTTSFSNSELSGIN